MACRKSGLIAEVGSRPSDEKPAVIPEGDRKDVSAGAESSQMLEGEPRSEPDGSTLEGAIALIERQAELLISVATQGHRIQQVEANYRDRDDALRTALRRWGISPPFPWRSLNDWYGAYQKYPHWHQRRTFIRGLADEGIERLRQIQDPILVDAKRGDLSKTFPTVEARLEALRERLASAHTLDDFQDVGRRAREVLIAAVDRVFVPTMVPRGQEPPKKGDAKTRFDLILETRFGGAARAETRAFMRAAWDLANKVTHGGQDEHLDEFRQDSVAAGQATVAIVRILLELVRT